MPREDRLEEKELGDRLGDVDAPIADTAADVWRLATRKVRVERLVVRRDEGSLLNPTIIYLKERLGEKLFCCIGVTARGRQRQMQELSDLKR